jgi:glycosyltransferase involved in cell wall biosynthesis
MSGGPVLAGTDRDGAGGPVRSGNVVREGLAPPDPARPSLRVAFVITGLGPGGAERQLLLLSSRLRRRGWPVLVVSLGGATGLEPAFADCGVEVVYASGRQAHAPGGRALLRTAALLRRWRPDVVHGFMFHANVFTRLLRPFLPGAVNVSSVRTSGEHAGVRARVYRLTDALCDLVTHVSPTEARDFVARRVTRPAKAVWMPNGVETGPAPARVAEARPFRWVALGRLEEAKDYPLLLQAFARVAEPAELWIAGAGSLRPALEAQVARLGLDGRVRLRGHLPSAEVLAQADGYVLSSRREGMPNALLEAAGAGLPVVVTSVGAVPEVMARLRNGLVVPSGDAGALAEAMREVMRMDSAERERLGARGREGVVRGFAMDQAVDRWCALYHAAAALRQGRAVAADLQAASDLG